MIVKSVHIKRFRGFNDVYIDLGKNISVIAGKNGTQKTTLLGILSQTFSLRNHPTMSREKPLCGGSYISSFIEKFKLSKKYDKPKSHEWTLHLYDDDEEFTIESIPRDKDNIRFWKKGTHEGGSGYIQLPVIYLSLKRLYPIGEDKNIHPNNAIALTDDEKREFAALHNKILVSLDIVQDTDYLESKDKNTLGVNTDYYDWQENSAGQDNLGKIILAMLSFERLKREYPNDYKGGLLVIDEVDATLHPGSQVKLFDALLKFSDRMHVQIMVTTHSLPLIKRAFDDMEVFGEKNVTKDKIRVIYLEKKDKKVVVENDITYESIKNRLNLISPKKHEEDNKVSVYCEDLEAMQVAKCLLHDFSKSLNFIKIKLGHNEYINLVQAKVPSFYFPNAIVLLDGDVSTEPEKMEKIGRYKNILCLPTKYSPEQMMAHYLNDLKDEDKLWEKINTDYLKDVCFRDYLPTDICTNRDNAKSWFKSQTTNYGASWVNKVINSWKKSHETEYKSFIETFSKVLDKCLTEKRKRETAKIV